MNSQFTKVRAPSDGTIVAPSAAPMDIKLSIIILAISIVEEKYSLENSLYCLY